MAARHVLKSGTCVILGYLICIVQGAHFEFEEGQHPCILLDIDTTFDLSMGTQMADPFSIEGANTTAAQSLCGVDTISAILALRLFPSDEQLKITFRKEASTQSVTMSVILVLDPKKHFENATEILPLELEDSDDLPIGIVNMSYQCNTQQNILFKQNPGYSMTMKITNLHVQAYNIENRTFSPAIECDQDMMTTVPTTTPSPGPTTQEASKISTNPTSTMESETTSTASAATIGTGITSPETNATTPETNATTPETNATTPEPVTSTPEPDTTTPRAVPTTSLNFIPKYEVKDGDRVCIAVQGEIRFNIIYERNDSQAANVRIMLPQDATVTGQCRYNGTNTTQEFKVNFFDDKWSFSALISQDEESLFKSSGSLLRYLQTKPSYAWKRVELIYVVDERFEDPKESDIGQTKRVTKEESDGVFRASTEGLYRCNTGQTEELDEEVSIDFGNFQYKAFGTDYSGDFNNNDVSVCSADRSNINNDSNNRTLIIALISVFGSIIFTTGIITFTVWRCKKNRKTHLLNETHENDGSYAGSDEHPQTMTEQEDIQSSLSKTNKINDVSNSISPNDTHKKSAMKHGSIEGSDEYREIIAMTAKNTKLVNKKENLECVYNSNESIYFPDEPYCLNSSIDSHGSNISSYD